jgi:hypothetical protein
MKKLYAVLLVLALVVCFAATGFAGRAYGPGGKHPRPETWTAEQQAGMIEFWTKKVRLRTDFLNGEAAAGRLSREVADAHITIMRDRLQKIVDRSSGPRDIDQKQWQEGRQARRDYHDKLRELRDEFAGQGLFPAPDGRGYREFGRHGRGGYGRGHCGGGWY